MTTLRDEMPAPGHGHLAARLLEAAAEMERARDERKPAPVVLAIARRAFAVAGMISVLLDEEAVPARDAYQAGDQYCRSATTVLDAALGRELIRRYGAGTTRADVGELMQGANFGMYLSDDADIDKIASAMITLAATLQDVLEAIAADESVPHGLRRVAAQARRAARMVWASYGGDSGGW